jgi:hypothetical protein
MSIFEQTGHTTPSLATAAIRAIIAADKAIPNQPTGWPSYKGEDIDSVRWGMVLEQIVWSSDRGNWMWDGVLATLRALGVDTGKPL